MREKPLHVSAVVLKYGMTETGNETGVVSTPAGNHYAMVNGFVYHLRAFGREDQAQMFATCISGNPTFRPEAGWQHITRFLAIR